MGKYKNILVMIVFGVILAMPLLAMARLDAPTPVTPGQAVTLNEVERLINGVARFLIVVSVIIAVIFIVYGGIRWVTSQGNEEGVKKAQEAIKHGIYGALIILGVGVILQTLQGVISRTFFGTFQ